ncbi:MAG: hypothetical protein IPO83_04580 [Chitinophagaceae bacterium]|nr:hypothetical protein [Chitinophagaceae bacterium]
MKSLLLVLSCFAIFLCSCKKEYTCQCTDIATGVGTTSFTIKESNEDAADAECRGRSTATENCFLSF